MIVGIDLGTTNSLISYFTDEGAKIIPNRLGKNLTPSIVSIDENNNILVGETAREKMLLDPDSAASIFKRDMGSKKTFKLGDKDFTAEELSSFVLKALKEDAESYLHEKIDEAVISVPAYFNNARRKATKRAGELAGFKVERIISEPTAAAVSYGIYQENKDARFLVFDLGGGTFDVSILELFGSILEVRAVAGDNFLGGEDFTAVIEDMFFKEHSNLDREKLTKKQLRYIHKKAEKAKLDLGNNLSSKMVCRIDDEEYEYVLHAKEYEMKCYDLLDRIKNPIKKSLQDAGIKVKDIDKVVMVGGATKLMIIKKFVSKLFRSMPDTSVNPDEVVAKGCAIQAAMKERNEAIKEVILTDVCPFTLGTEVVIERENNKKEDGHYCPIIERNTVIPASRTERLCTVNDNQKKITIEVLQGESRFAKNNLLLEKLTVDVPEDKAGKQAVDVTYTYDVNSILEVEVKVVSTGETTKEIIKNQDVDMTDEEIEQRMKELEYLKIHPKDQEENKLLLLRGERLYEESIGNDRMIIEYSIREFEEALESQDNKKIAQARTKFEEFLDSHNDEF